MIILEHYRIINNPSATAASAKVHTLSADLEHVSPKTTSALTEQESGTGFPLKTGCSYWSVGGDAVRTEGALAG